MLRSKRKDACYWRAPSILETIWRAGGVEKAYQKKASVLLDSSSKKCCAPRERMLATGELLQFWKQFGAPEGSKKRTKRKSLCSWIAPPKNALQEKGFLLALLCSRRQRWRPHRIYSKKDIGKGDCRVVRFVIGRMVRIAVH